jgi:hypothetical protein
MELALIRRIERWRRRVEEQLRLRQECGEAVRSGGRGMPCPCARRPRVPLDS